MTLAQIIALYDEKETIEGELSTELYKEILDTESNVIGSITINCSNSTIKLTKIDIGTDASFSAIFSFDTWQNTILQMLHTLFNIQLV